MAHSKLNTQNSSFCSNEQWLSQVGLLYDTHQEEITNVLNHQGNVKKSVNIAGFTIDVADDDATKEFKEKMVREAESIKALKTELNTAGITPIAMLPEDIFNKIIAKAGFYTFYRIQPDGKVYGNGQNYKAATGSSNSDVNTVFIGLVISIVLFAVSSVTSLYYWGTVAIISLLIFVVARKADFGGETKSERIIRRIIVSLFVGFGPSVLIVVLFIIIKKIINLGALRNKNWKKEKLWPKFNDVDEMTDDLFSLDLPKTPQRVNILLAKCYQHNVQTFLSIAPQAFNVVLDKKTKKILEEKYDPIICTRKNGIVAVLEQFGDFPDEKEIMRYIAEHFDAMRNDLLPSQAN